MKPLENATMLNSDSSLSSEIDWLISFFRTPISPAQPMLQDLSRHQKKPSPSYSPP